MIRFASVLNQRLRRIELPVLMLFVVAAAGVWAFAKAAKAGWAIGAA
jgi:hypothetical protein